MTHCDATTVCHFWKLSVRPYRKHTTAANWSEPSVTPWNAERQAVEFGVEIRRVTTAWSGFNGVGFNASY
jgi:hypothetical protein